MPIGGGGFGFKPILEATDDGLESLSPPGMGFNRGRPPGIGGAGGAPGGFGAAPRGGFGTELLEVSGSDRYGVELWSAPVFTPPDFLNFGMPPANKPPSCGADAIALSPPVSLLLRALFPDDGGASPGGAGGRPIPGTGGADPMGGALGPSETLPTIGADRSFICVTFLSLAPLPMSDSRAPCQVLAIALYSAESCMIALFSADGEICVLVLLPTAVLALLGPSCQALAAEVEALRFHGPLEAWGEGEEVRA